MRISGVPVGKVKTIEPDRRPGARDRDDRAARRATRRCPRDAQGDPAPEDAAGRDLRRADAGHARRAGTIPEGGALPAAQVSETVELDEIFRAFDPKTRAAFQTWMQEQAQAIDGRGRDINDALGNLEPFAEDAARLLDILNRRRARSRLVSDTGVVFDALTERGGQLRALITNSNRVFATTAARDRELQELFIVLPTFNREADAHGATAWRSSRTTPTRWSTSCGRPRAS